VDQSGDDQSGLFEREGVTRAHGRKLGRERHRVNEPVGGAPARLQRELNAKAGFVSAPAF
jgi:hypothetical protein